jgi:hypothetical protein
MTDEEKTAQDERRRAQWARWDALTPGQRDEALGWLRAGDPDEFDRAMDSAAGRDAR